MRHTRLTNETPDYLEWIDGYNGVARHLFDLGSEEWHLLDLTPQGRGDWYAELEYPPPAS